MDSVYIGPPEFELEAVWEEWVYDFKQKRVVRRKVYQPLLLPIEVSYAAQLPMNILWRKARGGEKVEEQGQARPA